MPNSLAKSTVSQKLPSNKLDNGSELLSEDSIRHLIYHRLEILV